MLKTRWKTRQEALTAIKLHSTLQNRRVKTDPTKSNNMQTTIVCYGKCRSDDENSEDSEEPDDPRFECKYHVCLRRSKAKTGPQAMKPWHISSKTTPQDLIHREECLSKANITTAEAMLRTKNTCERTSTVSIKETTKRISLDNTIPDTGVKGILCLLCVLMCHILCLLCVSMCLLCVLMRHFVSFMCLNASLCNLYVSCQVTSRTTSGYSMPTNPT